MIIFCAGFFVLGLSEAHVEIASAVAPIAVMDFRTPNLIQYSEDLTQAVWATNYSITITQNEATPPAGTSAVSHIVCSNGEVSQNITVRPYTNYTVSFWAKNNGGTKAEYAVYNTGGSAIVSVTSYFSQLSSDWNLVTLSFDSAGNTSVKFYPMMHYSGATADVYITGIRAYETLNPQSYTSSESITPLDLNRNNSGVYGDGTVGTSRPYLEPYGAWFDGVGRYASLPSMPGVSTNAFSIETVQRRPLMTSDYNYTTAAGPAFKTSGGYAYALFGGANPVGMYFSAGTLDLHIKGTFGGVSLDQKVGSTDPYWNHYVYTYDGSNVHVYRNGALWYSAPASGSITESDTSAIFGAKTSSSNFSWNQMAEARVYNYALNVDEVSERFSSAESDFANQGVTFGNPQIVFDGDSQTAGPADDKRTSYPTLFVADYGSPLDWANLGWSGATVSNISARATDLLDPIYSAQRSKNILATWIGTNDLYGAGETGGDIVYNNIVSYYQARKAVGWKVIGVTILPRSDTGVSVNYETNRQVANDKLRMNCGVGNGATLIYTNNGGGKSYKCVDGSDINALFDIAVDTRVGDDGDETDLTYYNNEKIHLNATGRAIVADGVLQTVNRGGVDDTTVPVITAFIIPAAANSLIAGITTFIASDNISVTNYCLSETNDSLDCTWTSTVPTQYTFSSDGDKTIYAFAKDAAGNISTSSSANIIVDTIPPIVTDSITPKFSTGTTEVTLSLTTDETSTCHYSINPTDNYAAMTSFTNTNSTTHATIINSLTPNSYTYYAKCQDSNTNETSYTLTFEIAPREENQSIDSNLKINSSTHNIQNKKIYSDQKKITLKGQDNNMTNGEIKIYKDSHKWKTLHLNFKGEWDKGITLSNNISTDFKLKYFDQFGTELDSDSFTVNVDTTKPTFTTPLPTTINKNQPINFEATDNQKISYYKIKLLDDQGHILRNRKQTKDTYTIPVTIQPQASTIVIRAYDKAGNYTEQKAILTNTQPKTIATTKTEVQGVSDTKEETTNAETSVPTQEEQVSKPSFEQPQPTKTSHWWNPFSW